MISKSLWHKILRRSARVLVIVSGIVAIAWFSLIWYVHAHKTEILAKLSSSLSAQMQGDLQIKEAEISPYRGFPSISITLKGVSLRDSMWSVHHHSLLEAKEIFVKVNPFALLRRRTEIKKITLAHATIFLYTDSLGYSNGYLFAKRDSTKSKKGTLVDNFGMEDVHLWYVNDTKYKLFHLYFKDLFAHTTESGDVTRVKLQSSAHAYEFNFSTIRGSYIHNQDLDLDVSFTYDRASKHFSMPEQPIRIGGTKVVLGASFYFDRKPPSFAIHFYSNSILYKTAAQWMSPNIQKVVDSYDFEKPIALDASISGLMAYRTIPLVKVVYKVQDNVFHTPFAQIDGVSYTGLYFNEARAGAGHGDDNSLIGVYGFKGSWRNLPLNSDTIEVTNLLNPIAKAHLSSSFELSSLNDILGGDVMQLDKGRATAELRYAGSIRRDDPSPYDLRGTVKVENAGFTYLPRNLAFTNVAATLLFSGDNLFFRNISLRSGQNTVAMEGDALHFLHFYFNNPDKINLSWRLRSPFINLNDFVSFVGKRKETGARQQLGKKINRVSSQLDKVLDQGNFSLDARIDKLMFRKFTGSGVVAQLTLGNSGIILQKVQISREGGFVNLSGIINQSAVNNPFNLNAHIQNVNVAQLFTDFENFGQTALGSDNLRGRLSADAAISGNITNSGSLLNNSLKGTVSFDLKDGALNNFEPLEKVGKFAFKKRNLSAVDVKDLHGRFEVNGNKILIAPMEIQTSVINMNVQGVYGIGGGTDIYMEIPLRNPEKEEAATPIGMLLRKGKGFVVHLRGQDPDGRGVKIGWDPLRHGRSATKEKLER